MKRPSAMALIGTMVIVFVLFAIGSTLPLLLHIGAQTTGVCIFKGPAIIGLFTSSDGVPLRGIGVTASHSGGFGGTYIDAAGPTDRLGCFTFRTNIQEHLNYIYNGTGYVDTVDPGVILRDSLP